MRVGGVNIPAPMNIVSPANFVVSVYDTLPVNAIPVFYNPPTFNDNYKNQNALFAIVDIPLGYAFVLRGIWISVYTSVLDPTPRLTAGFLNTVRGLSILQNNFDVLMLSATLNDNPTVLDDVAIHHGAYHDFVLETDLPIDAGSRLRIFVYQDPSAAAPSVVDNYGQNFSIVGEQRMIGCYGHLIPNTGALTSDLVVNTNPIPVRNVP